MSCVPHVTAHRFFPILALCLNFGCGCEGCWFRLHVKARGNVMLHNKERIAIGTCRKRSVRQRENLFQQLQNL